MSIVVTIAVGGGMGILLAQARRLEEPPYPDSGEVDLNRIFRS